MQGYVHETCKFTQTHIQKGQNTHMGPSLSLLISPSLSCPYIGTHFKRFQFALGRRRTVGGSASPLTFSARVCLPPVGWKC